MITKTYTIAFLLFLAGRASGQVSAQIQRVKDGDTFVAKWHKQSWDCRLSGIDAPELSQAFGIQSKDSLELFLLGKRVKIDSLKKDLYGRILVDVWVSGKRLDSIAVARGWAWHYEDYAHDVVLANAMQYAITHRLGIWRCGKRGVCPPWRYRKLSFLNRKKYSKTCN